jgi:hypothetical protein
MILPKDPKMGKKSRARNAPYVCALEGCEEELNEVTVKNLDPFCSTTHCNEYFGVEILKPRPGSTVGSSS